MNAGCTLVIEVAQNLWIEVPVKRVHSFTAYTLWTLNTIVLIKSWHWAAHLYCRKHKTQFVLRLPSGGAKSSDGQKNSYRNWKKICRKWSEAETWSTGRNGQAKTGVWKMCVGACVYVCVCLWEREERERMTERERQREKERVCKRERWSELQILKVSYFYHGSDTESYSRVKAIVIQVQESICICAPTTHTTNSTGLDCLLFQINTIKCKFI